MNVMPPQLNQRPLVPLDQTNLCDLLLQGGLPERPLQVRGSVPVPLVELRLFSGQMGKVTTPQKRSARIMSLLEEEISIFDDSSDYFPVTTGPRKRRKIREPLPPISNEDSGSTLNIQDQVLHRIYEEPHQRPSKAAQGP